MAHIRPIRPIRPARDRRRALTDADLEFPVSRARRRAGAALEVAFWFLAAAGVALGLAAILME